MDPEDTIETVAPAAEAVPQDKPGMTESDVALVTKLQDRIRQDKLHHKEAFERMREDMMLATHGHNKNWPKGHYVANIIGRHVKQKTAALYAKNPKIVAKRRETLDFATWDENPDSLMLAQQTIQLAAQPPMPQVDPMTGMVTPPPAPPGPEELQLAMQTMQDFQQGLQRRQLLSKYGNTLEILFNHTMRNQRPLDFKMGMKKLVRRACTTGVGYVKLAFTREYGPAPLTQNRMDDVTSRLAHLERLSKDAAEEEIEAISAEMRELELSLASLQQEELVVVQEGLTFDYPQSTRVIPDKRCLSLVGFVGARHLTLEYLYSPDEVREMFPDADLDVGFTPYQHTWDDDGTDTHSVQTDSNGKPKAAERNGMVLVYEHFDKASGLVYYMAEGYGGFLRAPAPPDVFVEDFWPVYALTFNEVENEKELFPPSDARLMMHQQFEMNRSRQGLSEHRQAARPRFGMARGALDDTDRSKLGSAEPFDVIDLNMTPDQKIGDLLQAIPVPGVDPNLYETSAFFQDLQLVVGSQQATLGGIAKATATEAAIAESSMAASDGSSVDDLDNFLTMVARAGGQILQREMSAERVMAIVGPGAVWPELPLDQIADEMFLEVEAGSSGKPNQAVEIQNMQTLLPMLMQMPGLNQTWLLKQVLKRMDDRLDVTEAIAAGVPSIAATNQMAQPNAISPGGPQENPDAQGAEGQAGASNAPAGPSMTPGGSGPAFGSNQVN